MLLGAYTIGAFIKPDVATSMHLVTAGIVAMMPLGLLIIANKRDWNKPRGQVAFRLRRAEAGQLNMHR
jgi:hypothetical protein